MAAMLKHGSRGDISFAAISIPGKSNEDCHYINLSHNTADNLRESNRKDFASFGVFDGHLGGFTSNLCSTLLHADIADRYYAKLANFQQKESLNMEAFEVLNGDDIEDFLFCQAINEAVLHINAQAHAKDSSGSTMCSAFIHPRPVSTNKVVSKKNCTVEVKTEGYYKVVLSNIGDSRALLVLSDSIAENESNTCDYIPLSPLSPLGQSYNSVGDFSPNSNESTPQMTASPSREFIDEDFLQEEIVSDLLSIEEAQSSSHFYYKPNFSKISSKFVQVSEDHNLVCERERHRISHKISLLPQLLPYDISFQSILCRRLHNIVALDISSPRTSLKLKSFSPPSTPKEKVPLTESFPSLINFDIEISDNNLISNENLKLKGSTGVKRGVKKYKSILFSKKINFEVENTRYKSCSISKPFKNSPFSSIKFPPFEESKQLIFYGNGYFLSPNGTDLDLDAQAITNYAKKLDSAKKLYEDSIVNLDHDPIVDYDHDQVINLPKGNESFFAHRINKNVCGPVAFFSRIGNSILMTRSIGDSNGPRSCLPLPEITSFNVPFNRYARLILATDGVWDVIDNETVRRMSFYYKFSTPSELAQAIAYKARRRRERFNIRLDDITVIVIDFSPSNGIFLKEWNNVSNKLYNGSSSSKYDQRVKGGKFSLPLDISNLVNISNISTDDFMPLIETKTISSTSDSSCPVS